MHAVRVLFAACCVTLAPAAVSAQLPPPAWQLEGNAAVGPYRPGFYGPGMYGPPAAFRPPPPAFAPLSLGGPGFGGPGFGGPGFAPPAFDPTVPVGFVPRTVTVGGVRATRFDYPVYPLDLERGGP